MVSKKHYIVIWKTLRIVVSYVNLLPLSLSLFLLLFLFLFFVSRNAVYEMEGLQKPSWLPEDIYRFVMFKASSSVVSDGVGWCERTTNFTKWPRP